MTAANSERTARRLLVVLGMVFLATLPAVTPRIYASDEIEYFAYLRSAWFDRDFSFENEYRHFHDAGVADDALFRETFLERRTPTGRRENFATIGCAILWAPFYLVADLTARSGVGGTAWPADGYSTPYIAAVAYGSAVYGFLALLAGWWAALAVVGGARSRPAWPGATGAMLTVWFGTPLLFYMYIAPPMSHACSAFAVAVFLLAWLRVRRRWSPAGCAALGALAALMTMVREQDAFFALGPALDFGGRLVGSLRAPRAGAAASASSPEPSPGRLATGALAAAAAFAVTFVPQALAYLAVNGRLGPSRVVGQKMAWHAPHAWSVLFSPEHGLLAWTPLAGLALAGLLVLLRQRAASEAAAGPAFPAPMRGLRTWLPASPADARWIAACLLVMAASQVYIAGSVRSWTVAGAFGQRRFVGLTALLVVGLSALASRAVSRGRRVALAAACVLGIWWNVGLLVQFGAGMMDRQRLDLARNAFTTFVRLPVVAPSLAYRYLFDRASFYRDAGRPAAGPGDTPR